MTRIIMDELERGLMLKCETIEIKEAKMFFNQTSLYSSASLCLMTIQIFFYQIAEDETIRICESLNIDFNFLAGCE